MQAVQLGELDSVCRELLSWNQKGATAQSMQSSTTLLDSTSPIASFDESDELSNYGGSSSIFSPSSSLASPTPSTSGTSSPALVAVKSEILEACDNGLPSTSLGVDAAQVPDGKAKQRYAAHLVRREAQALLELAERLEQEEETDPDSFTSAVEAIQSMEKYGKILLSGVGKSGLLARKAVATFNSLGRRRCMRFISAITDISISGIQSAFLHPVEALHGDVGILSPYGLDTVVLVSYSGRTKELLPLVQLLRNKGCHSIISLTTPRSPLALVSDITLDVTVENDEEADPTVPAPTSSVLTALAMLDSLALTLLRQRTGWDADVAERCKVFATNHPGGSLGQQLAVQD